MNTEPKEHNPENSASAMHPHEPEIPPALDSEGRCLVCCQMVLIDQLRAQTANQAREITDLRAALAECVAALETYKLEYEKALDESDREAKKWHAEGDMYGWNFHQGRHAGRVDADISIQPIKDVLTRATSILGAQP